MSAATELVHDLLAALDGVPGLRPATLARPARLPWEWNWDALAIDVTNDPEAAGGQIVVVRAVATRLPLRPVIGQAEEALLAVLAASALPITRLRLEITDLDGTALA